MASTKDIFEAKHFAANIFAAGLFRGTGVTPDIPDIGDIATLPQSVQSIVAGPQTVSSYVAGPQTVREKGT